MRCAFCKFGPDDADVEALFVIDGQGVCEKHVDHAGIVFGRALNQMWNEVQEDAVAPE